MDGLSTREKLLQIGREEFLRKGYKDASLREIAKKAGFTLGAFYGYYASKESLFDDIVKEPAQRLYDYYLRIQTDFANLPVQRQTKELDQVSDQGLFDMLDIIYDDFDAFKLVFFRSSGTEYANYLHRLIDVEIHHTNRYIQLLKAQGKDIQIDTELTHILASAMLSGMLEVVDHDMDKQKAKRYIGQLRRFYAAGWHCLFEG